MKKGLIGILLIAVAILLTANHLEFGKRASPGANPDRAENEATLWASGFKISSVKLAGSQKRWNGEYDLIIYGGGPQAVSTALKAANTTNDLAKTLMIVPSDCLGSILTAGKQNLFDLNYYRTKRRTPGIPSDYEGTQGGTMFRFLRDMGSVFPPDEMARYLRRQVQAHPNITVWYDTDITDVQLAAAGTDAGASRIEAVRVQPIRKDADGRYVFSGDKSAPLKAKVFVDASESGRLARFAQVDYTIGRQDQGIDSRQMGATLMYKIKGVDAYAAVKTNRKLYGYAYSTKGAFQFWAGNEAFTIPEMIAYDKASDHFRIKGYNAGEDGISHVGGDTRNAEFWMNQLLIYNVDARKAWRDLAANNGHYPSSDGLDPEIAREMAIEELKKPNFIRMVRKLPGFETAELVYRNGQPVVGDMLYLRESIHTTQGAPNRFALNRQDVMNGGERWYARRIGIGFYNFDSNTYTKEESLSNPLHEPWYVPYDVLVSPKVANLLLPGYAASIDSFAWTAMRVYPNLIMLGDAAGTAAGLALLGDFHILRPTEGQIEELQQVLRDAKVILEK